MDNEKHYNLGLKAAVITILENIILSAAKLIIGIATSSVAVVSDAVHSISDVFTTIIAIIGLRISKNCEDKEHPYGHEKFEPAMGMVLAVILAFTALFIGWEGIQKMSNPADIEISVWAIGVTIVSILVKEHMYWYTLRVAKKINSPALVADAWHHRSDSISSLGALIGLWGAKLGFLWMEPLAAVFICLIILKVSYDILMQSMQQLIDKSASEETLNKISSMVMSVDGVLKIDDLKTRIHGAALFVDIEIAVDNLLTVVEAHNIAETVHDLLESADMCIKHCMVHVNPSQGKGLT